MPAFRLALLSIRSEKVARIPMQTPISTPVIPIKRYATMDAIDAPTTAPSQLLFGEIEGANPLLMSFLKLQQYY